VVANHRSASNIFSFLPVFGLVKDLGFPRDMGHSLLGEGKADDVIGEVLNGILLFGLNSWGTMHVDHGVPPRPSSPRPSLS
jgi:hypothetical protein